MHLQVMTKCDMITSNKSKKVAEAPRSRQHRTCIRHACAVCNGLRQHLAGAEQSCRTTRPTCTIHVEGKLRCAHNGLLIALYDAWNVAFYYKERCTAMAMNTM